jgi:hypothetical protein
VDLTPDDPSINAPSRYLLWVHFLITQVYHASGVAEQDDEEDDNEMGDVSIYEEVDYADAEEVYGDNEEAKNLYHLTERNFADMSSGGEYDFVDRVWHWPDESYSEFPTASGGILV